MILPYSIEYHILLNTVIVGLTFSGIVAYMFAFLLVILFKPQEFSEGKADPLRMLSFAFHVLIKDILFLAFV